MLQCTLSFISPASITEMLKVRAASGHSDGGSAVKGGRLGHRSHVGWCICLLYKYHIHVQGRETSSILSIPAADLNASEAT